jgi:signal transduction histidine kinase
MAGATSPSSSTGLEPGLQRLLRFLVVLHVFGTIVFRRPIGVAMGVEAPTLRSLMLTLPGPLILVALVWIPSWEGRRGRVLLPLALVFDSVNLLGDKFLTLSWLDAPANRELDGVLLLVRLWMNFHVVTLLIAWQYLWRAAVASGLVLCAADFALSLPFNRPGGRLYPLFLVISFARVGTLTLVAMAVGWLIERQREQKAALAAANHKLAAYAATTEQLAISRERNRLARELHDTLAHSLAAVTVQLEGVLALWDHNAEAARTMLASASQNARSGLVEARRALKALRASPLEDHGLAVALGNLARSAAARANLQLALESPTDGLALRADQEQFLYRVAQEAISNVVRHAHATELRVTLHRNNGQLVLTIADNGQGFEQASADSSGHFGLKGMQERVEMAGGWFTVESARQRGTTVRAAIEVEAGT